MGGKAPWILKILTKKFIFLVLSGNQQISPLLASPRKILEKSASGPSLEKILPTPMNSTQLSMK